MADSRISAPASGLDALGIVDLSDPGPSSSHPPGRGMRSMSTTHSLAQSQRSADDHTNETLGLPPDAQVIRVPEGQTYRVRAVYDFAATDESALSFHAGDVIEVLTMLPSGWWDGMLGTSRGWFPSNYVEDVDAAELDDGDETDDEDGYSAFGQTPDKRFIEIAPDGRAIPRNGGGPDMLGLEDRGRWNDWGGADNEPSLDDVAHEVMAGRERETSSQDSATGTERARRNGTADPDETLHASHRGEREDVWVPSLTPDGRLFYHNTLTGEESWSIPGGEARLDISSNTSQNGDAISEAGGSRYGPGAHGGASRRDSVTSSVMSRSRVMPDDFRMPPGRGPAGVPHPWVARLSDDGRGWYYYNQATGETRREPPPAPNRLEGSDAPQRAHGPGYRSSHSVQNRRTQDWEDRIRSSLAPLYAPPPRPSMALLVEAIHDAISQVYNAALAGVSADEELAVARSTHTGFALAIQHDEGAIERATSAIEAVVSTVRDLVVAFGYVGPLMSPSRGYDSSLPDETMVRPSWANDMSLVGNLGLIQYMTHLAITGSRNDPTANPWGAVMRAATKLRAVIDGMPHLLTAETPGIDVETAKGRRLAAWFGADALGDFMSGRFGFGPQLDIVLRDLDAAAIADVKKAQEVLEAAIAESDSAEDGGVLETIRATSRFRETVTNIDVAAAIDLDGDLSDMTSHPDTHHEDVRAYADLVSKARHALRELDETALQLDSAAADVYLRWDSPGAASTRDELGQTMEAVFSAVSSLLTVAQQQSTMLEQGNVRGSLGARSPAAMARRAAAAAHARKQSQASMESGLSGKADDRGDGHNRQASGTSLASQRTHQTTGTDAEFLEQDDTPTSGGGKRRSHRLSRHSQSASTSQTSLVNTNRQSTSSTSLPYQQDAEVNSMRQQPSNRASILKAVPSFLRRDDVGSKMKSGKKLAKLLGDDSIGSRLGSISSSPTAPSAPPPPVPAPMSAPPAAAIRSEPAWYLSTDYPVGEIVFDDKGGVRAGTIQALVVRLTTHVSYDNAFFQEFLLTFRSFVAPEDLIELLIERYNITAPEGLAGEQLKEWQLRKQTPVRLRVANTLKAWLDNHYYEKEDLHALELIEEFAKTTVATGSEMISRQLQQLVERKRRGDGDALSRRVLTSGNQPPPLPLLPRSQQGRPLHVLDIQPLELARQFTIMESNCFQRIKPSECMHKAWTRPDAADIAPNVTRIIVTTNRIAVWIGLQVLRTKDVKMRAQIIKQFMHTAAAARELNNYSTMAGIVAALSASHLSRLKKTWELLSDKTMAEWADIQLSMDSTKNFGKYKEMLKTINPPCVPFLGFYLSALVFIEDGNKDMVTPQQQPDGITSVPMTPTASQTSMPRRPSVATSTNSMTMSRMSTAWSNGTASTLINGDNSSQPPPTPGQTLINFNKRHMTADILRDIQQYQSQPYNLAMCNPIYQWVEQGLEKAADETQDLYEVSLTVEPKDVGNSNRI